MEYPLPEFSEAELKDLNFPNSQGFVYEIEAVVKALDGGNLETEHMSWSQSVATMKLMDQARTKIGLPPRQMLEQREKSGLEDDFPSDTLAVVLPLRSQKSH